VFSQAILPILIKYYIETYLFKHFKWLCSVNFSKAVPQKYLSPLPLTLQLVGKDKLRNLKIRTINKTQEEYDNEKKLSKIKKDDLKVLFPSVLTSRPKLLKNISLSLTIARSF
jgi:hypothetical protein